MTCFWYDNAIFHYYGELETLGIYQSKKHAVCLFTRMFVCALSVL